MGILYYLIKMENHGDEQIRRILSDEVYLTDLVDNAFIFLDFDKSGFLDPSEIKYLVGQYNSLSNVDINSLVKNFDANNDGKLGKEEFRKLFKVVLEMLIQEP